MTVKEAAGRLEISISLVYGLIAVGKLPCTRHGLRRGCIRISEEQLATYLAAASTRPAAPPPARKGPFRHVRLPGS